MHQVLSLLCLMSDVPQMYQCYADYSDMMELAEALVEAAALAVRGTLSVPYQVRCCQCYHSYVPLTIPWRAWGPWLCFCLVCRPAATVCANEWPPLKGPH